MAEQHLEMLAQKPRLTERIPRLTNELHQAVCVGAKPVPLGYQLICVGRRRLGTMIAHSTRVYDGWCLASTRGGDGVSGSSRWPV